jgi:hypothetical protein
MTPCYWIPARGFFSKSIDGPYPKTVDTGFWLEYTGRSSPPLSLATLQADFTEIVFQKKTNGRSGKIQANRYAGGR